MQVAFPSQLARCPYCGSSRLVISSHSVVCASCGTVLEELELYYGPAPAQQGEEPGRARRSAHSPAVVRPRGRLEDELYSELRERLGVRDDKALAVVDYVARNECVRHVVERAPSDIRAQLALFAYDYGVEGVYDLPSYLADDKRVRRRLVSAAKRLLRRCAPGPPQAPELG